MRKRDHREVVARKRYYRNGNEGWKKLSRRVGKAIASEEKDHAYWTNRMSSIIENYKFLPAGRILRNAGYAKRAMLNCFVIPIGDSIESIGQCIKDSLITWSSGGGVGINFSNLRPVGTEIQGKGGQSSGLVSFMEAINGVASTIETGGQRRSAALAMIDISHPEVEEFMDSKLEHGRLSYFNISVAVNNKFLEAVEQDLDWDLVFRKKVYKTVKARKLWDKIIKNIIKSAEPGIINWDNLVKANSFSFNPILCVNPCSELPLPGHGSCDLGSLVLPYYVKDGRTQWQEMKEVIQIAVRLLDNVLDLTTYPVPQMKEVTEAARRIGLGTMGLADYFFAKKIRYGSEESLRETMRLYKFIRDTAYEASIKLAKEKGPFPEFDSQAYSKASFVKHLPAKIRKKIKKDGIRNVAMITCPPTGSTSLVAGVTSGIEPLYSKAHRRVDRISERVYIHEIYRDILKSKKNIPDWYVDSFDLSPEEHFEMQATIQRYVDGAISKTINCPKETTVDKLSGWLLEYMYDLKGATIYVDQSREKQVLYPLGKKDAIKIVEQEEENTT